ncbi:acyltransferase family protein [Lysobacter enzymogenes]|uniref:acyltransferase family protein n=1 Tax=Lysobacter enzymogenes TaxID=69 RepID=UPI00089815F3|nr:acyltransferase [Lysobacter enzymogenes]SDX75126.1 Peptidoglycan/LPS O-acetylase OafA/YrhL, contains acyltransferase and SGNH-hydrolase domains [Lysobacter enzymogenes]
MVDTHSVWPYFALMLAAFALASLPWFRAADPAGRGSGRRTDTLDGLRGFLALSVFAVHAIVHYDFLRTGVWKPSSAQFYNVAGVVSVALFFMLTGFLFWNKLLKAGGRPGWKELYIGRVFRLGPMYVAAVATMIVIVAYRTGFEWRQPPLQVIAQALAWLALGIVPPPPAINGYADTGTILAGVTWTLFFEWVFYFSLPLWAFFVRRGRHLAFSAGAVAACLLVILAATWNGGFVPGTKPRPVLLLAVLAELIGMIATGMLVASLLHERIGERLQLQRAKWGALALLALALVFAAMLSTRNIGMLQLLVLCPLTGLFLFVLCSGNNLFGVLAWPASRRLSNMSYSIYLSQGLSMVAVFAIPGVKDYALSGTVPFWIVNIACALALCAASLLTYRYIEEPGIRAGKRLTDRLRARRAGAAPLATPASDAAA